MKLVYLHLFIFFFVSNLAFSQKCRFAIEDNIDDEENRKIQTTDIIINGLAPNNLSISFASIGSSYYINLEYLYINTSGVSVNGLSLPKSKFPNISYIDTSCELSFYLINGDKIVLKPSQEQKAQKRNLTQSTSEYKIKDLHFPVSVEDIEILHTNIIDKIDLQYLSPSSTDIQSVSSQISEMRASKINYFANCILNYNVD